MRRADPVDLVTGVVDCDARSCRGAGGPKETPLSSRSLVIPVFRRQRTKLWQWICHRSSRLIASGLARVPVNIWDSHDRQIKVLSRESGCRQLEADRSPRFDDDAKNAEVRW